MVNELSKLLPLAESIADGSPVDWETAENRATPDEWGIVQQLRILAEVAVLHRSLAGDVEQDPAAPLTPIPNLQTPIGSWAHLLLLERLGAGSFGDVYRAWDRQLEREVAVKLLRAESASNSELSRIMREGRLLAQIRNRRVVTVYGVATSDQKVGLWMELIRGVTLEHWLGSQGQASAREASLIGIDLCRALAAIHGAGLIHRDIKAQNVMREEGGRIVLMDLGTGRKIDESQRGILPDLVGTPLYLAPEIFEGKPASIRSDLYSLGVLLYYLVTKSYPVKAANIDDLQERHAKGTVTRLRDARPDLPPLFVRIVERAISRDPDRRYASAGGLESDLQEALAESSPQVLSRIGIRNRRVPSIAVLPFVDMNPEKNLEYFCDGISEEIIAALTKLRGLRVAARTSAFQFKKRAGDIRQVGEALGVETILEGSVRAAGNRLRITTQLSDAITGYQLWAERFSRSLDDVFAVQDEIATAVVRTLQVPLGAETPVVATSRPGIEAYAPYLKGRYHWNKRTEGGFSKSITYFRQALDRDPSYAQAYSGLAEAYVTVGMYGALAPDDVMPKARAMAEQAMKLAEDSPEVFTSLGCVSAMYDRAWTEAERHFRQAIDISPDYATAHLWLATTVLVPQGRFQEAEAELRIALDLDPLSLAIGTSVGVTAYYARQYSDAIDQLACTLELDNDFALAHFFLGQTYSELGRHDEAIRELEQAIGRSTTSPEMIAGLGYACARAGDIERAHRILDDLARLNESRYVSPFLFAQVFAGLGQKEPALLQLERAVADRAADAVWIGVRPSFEGVRDDARFEDLCRQVGVPVSGR